MRRLAAGLLVGSLVASAGTTLAQTPAPSADPSGEPVDLPTPSYSIWSPVDWVTVTSPDTEMDQLIEALEADRGPGAGDRLRGRFAYLRIVMDEWAPLFVLPTDDEQTLGCGIEAVPRPPRPLDEWFAQVRTDASFGRLSMDLAPELEPVDSRIGRLWVAAGITAAPGGKQQVHHSVFLAGGDGVEITVTCSALEPTEVAYWRPVIEGIAFSREGERRIEVPAGGFAVTVPDGWTVHTSGLGTGVDGGNQHLITLRPDEQSCNVWRWKEAPGVSVAPGDIDGFAEAFISTFREDSADVEVTEASLPAGEAVRIRDRHPDDAWHRTAYLLSDGASFHTLTCYSFDSDTVDWLPIAETFEFLPVGE